MSVGVNMGCCGVSKKKKCGGCQTKMSNLEKFARGHPVEMGQTAADEATQPLTTADVADFVLPQDKLPFVLAASMYHTPPDIIEDFIRVKSDSASVQTWIHRFDLVCIVALRGTDVFAEDGINNILDDMVVAGLAGVNQCALRIANETMEIIKDLEQRGFQEIIVTGHSLGGSAAFCVSSQSSKIVRAVSFNGGAPITNPVYQGAGPQKNMFYHIAGDIISTHMSPMAATVLRVQRVNGPQVPFASVSEIEEKFENSKGGRSKRSAFGRDRSKRNRDQRDGIDWFSSYNHSTKRFLRKDDYPWKLIEPQWEQNSLMRTLDKGPDVVSSITGSLINPKLDIMKRVKEMACTNPIPGAMPGPYCAVNEVEETVKTVAGAAIGGIAGFMIAGGSGIVQGALLGMSLIKGEAAFLQYANPAAYIQIDQMIDKSTEAIANAAEEAQTMGKDEVKRMAREGLQGVLESQIV